MGRLRARAPVPGDQSPMSLDRVRDLQEVVHQVFREDLSLEVADPELDLLESGSIDSLALVALIAGLEERLGIQVDFNALELDELRSIETIARMLERLTPSDGAPDPA